VTDSQIPSIFSTIFAFWIFSSPDDADVPARPCYVTCDVFESIALGVAVCVSVTVKECHTNTKRACLVGLQHTFPLACMYFGEHSFAAIEQDISRQTRIYV
jgi:hypothetical protein